MSLSDHLDDALVLKAMENATSQQPITFGRLLGALQGKLGRFVHDADLADATTRLHLAREINTATITRNGQSMQVFWPTGIKFLSAGFNGRTASAKPTPSEEPTMNGSKADRMIEIIERSGPIVAAALCARVGSGVLAKSVDAYLKPALTAGKIVTRKGYSVEQGKNLKHYMTPEQATAWDARETGQPAPAEALPAAAFSHDHDHETLLKLIGADSLQHAAEILTARAEADHNLKNDLAGANMLLNSLTRILQVESVVDIADAVKKLASEAAAAQPLMRVEDDGPSCPIPPTHQELPGKLAMLLIDSAGDAEIEHLDNAIDPTDARTRCRAAVEQGNVDRAALVIIIGEAKRVVEWRNAA